MNVNNKMLKEVCEKIYDHVKNEDGTVQKAGFIEKLGNRGILRDDPRISGFIKSIGEYHGNVEKDTFIKCISNNISVIENAFTNDFVITDFETFSNEINQLYEEVMTNDDGKMADYIPQLAKQNPKHFGVSICTIDGQRLNIGDSDVNFCLQSCSKPITYCLALEEHGKDKVHKHVGREPSGSEFNALKLNSKGRPHNPLINSGAIMSCSLVKNKDVAADRFDYVTKMWKKMAAGRELGYNNSVYLSERMSADRNFALAYFMNENGAFPDNTNIVEVLEFYFQCCSLTLNSDSLSIIAATLANGGVCPLTGEEVISSENVKHCLSMMYSCGMYDYSGEFAFKIGLPAKSGVAGGIFVVIPNVMGVCTFSPLLDDCGNSVRGVDFFSKLTKTYNFHLFDNLVNVCDTKKNPRKKINVDELTAEKVIKYSSLGDLSALKQLRIKNGDFSQGDYDNRTPLHLASSNGHLNVVKYLIDTGKLMNINPIDRWGGTPYDDAIRESYDDIATYLKSIGGKSGTEIYKKEGVDSISISCNLP